MFDNKEDRMILLGLIIISMLVFFTGGYVMVWQSGGPIIEGIIIGLVASIFGTIFMFFGAFVCAMPNP